MDNNRKQRVINTNDVKLNSRLALRKLTLSINIKRYTTDSTGLVLDDAVVPIAERKPYPFHLFGEFDRQGAYSIADKVLSGIYNTKFFGYYVGGIGTPLFFFSPLATIQNFIKKGDMVFIYVDDLNAPTYFHHVIVSTDSGGYASITSQSNISQLDDNGQWGVFKFYDLKYSWINDAQYELPIYSILTRFNGANKFDTTNPESYLYTMQRPALKTIVVEIEAVLNQYFGLSTFIAWENSALGLTFNIYI